MQENGLENTETIEQKAEYVENSISQALKVIAVIMFIGGFIAGIALGNVEVVVGTYYPRVETEFSFAVALTYWFCAFVGGMVFLGFSEIIKLLDQINSKII